VSNWDLKFKKYQNAPLNFPTSVKLFKLLLYHSCWCATLSVIVVCPHGCQLRWDMNNCNKATWRNEQCDWRLTIQGSILVFRKFQVPICDSHLQFHNPKWLFTGNKITFIVFIWWNPWVKFRLQTKIKCLKYIYVWQRVLLIGHMLRNQQI